MTAEEVPPVAVKADIGGVRHYENVDIWCKKNNPGPKPGVVDKS